MKGIKPNIDSVSKKLALSRRNLQEKLKAEETTFRNCLESVRKQIALDYLAKPDVTICDIAFLLGYSEQSAFNHAFKRWTGKNPKAYCRELNWGPRDLDSIFQTAELSYCHSQFRLPKEAFDYWLILESGDLIKLGDQPRLWLCNRTSEYVVVSDGWHNLVNLALVTTVFYKWLLYLIRALQHVIHRRLEHSDIIIRTDLLEPCDTSWLPPENLTSQNLQ